jgi:hypothetical protein
MKKGEDAIKRLAEMDKNSGLTSKKKRTAEPQEVGVPPSSRSIAAEVPTSAGIDGVLSDADLARSRLAQAEMMKKNAAAMIAEAERLAKEAADLDPTVSHVTKPKAKKAKVKAA